MNSKAFVNLHKKLILLLSVAIYINPFLSQLNTIEKINNELLILNLKKISHRVGDFKKTNKPIYYGKKNSKTKSHRPFVCIHSMHKTPDN